jgi:hypothetical protein
MTDPDPHGFRLLDPYGNVIAHGSATEALAPLPDSSVRADAISLLHDAAKAIGLIEAQQEHAAQLRQREISTFCDGVASLGRRLDALEQQHASRARQAAADEAHRIQAAIDALPDPDDPAAYQPTGELHQVAATARDQGDLPREVTRDVPPDPGTDPEFDPAELSHGPDAPAQPVAISLNAADSLYASHNFNTTLFVPDPEVRHAHE